MTMLKGKPTPNKPVQSIRKSLVNSRQMALTRLIYALPVLIVVFLMGYITALLLPAYTQREPVETGVLLATALPIPPTAQNAPTPTPNAQINGDAIAISVYRNRGGSSG